MAAAAKNRKSRLKSAVRWQPKLAKGDARIFGVMIESHLKAGRQDLTPGKELVYGLSITDACVGWEDTRKLAEDLADAVRRRRVKAEAEGDSE